MGTPSVSGFHIFLPAVLHAVLHSHYKLVAGTPQKLNSGLRHFLARYVKFGQAGREKVYADAATGKTNPL